MSIFTFGNASFVIEIVIKGGIAIVTVKPRDARKSVMTYANISPKLLLEFLKEIEVPEETIAKIEEALQWNQR